MCLWATGKKPASLTFRNALLLNSHSRSDAAFIGRWLRWLFSRVVRLFFRESLIVPSLTLKGKIRWLRTALGLKQIELALAAGVSDYCCACGKEPANSTIVS